MFRRPMARLAVAAAAAGTICALGAGAASAAPNATWVGAGTVPGSATNNSPGLSSITFPNIFNGTGQIVGWRGRFNNGQIYYRYKVPGLHKGHWSGIGKVPGLTSSAPAFGSYVDPLGQNAVLAVWTGPADQHIWYAQGETRANGTIAWTKATALPPGVANTNTTAGPSVLFTLHAYRVIIAWRGPGTHVRFVFGNPFIRGFKWGDSKIVPGPPLTATCSGAPCTGNTPALAEVSNNLTTGSVYFVWREKDATAILYSTTPDPEPKPLSPVFTGPVVVPGAATLLGPAASDLGVNGLKPLMLAYKAPLSTAVRYQIFAAGLWTGPSPVPGVRTVYAPALLFNELATTTPSGIGNIVLHVFK